MIHVFVVLVRNIRNVVGDNMDKDQEFTTEMMIADILLRLKSLENILIAKGVLSEDQYLKEMEKVAQQISKSLLEKAQAQGGIDELITSIKA